MLVTPEQKAQLGRESVGNVWALATRKLYLFFQDLPRRKCLWNVILLGECQASGLYTGTSKLYPLSEESSKKCTRRRGAKLCYMKQREFIPLAASNR